MFPERGIFLYFVVLSVSSKYRHLAKVLSPRKVPQKSNFVITLNIMIFKVF